MSLIKKMRTKWQAKREGELVRQQFGGAGFTATPQWPAEPSARELLAASRDVGLDVDSAAKKNGKTTTELLTAIWDEGVNRQFIHHCMGESISLMDGFREVARECAEKFSLEREAEKR